MATPLKVWFVNVGHGDSTIVKFPSGRVMMVDINNCKTLDDTSRAELAESKGLIPVIYEIARQLKIGPDALKEYEDLLEDPIDVLKRECPGDHVFRFVATHPDMDHLTGLYRLSRQEPTISIGNFWDTANTKECKRGDFDESKFDWRDWEEYQRLRKCVENPTVLNLYRGSQGDFYTPDGIEVLSPTPQIVKDANESEDWNHLSQVHRITYGKSALLLTGDVNPDVQQEIADLYKSGLASTILAAPHHGRESCYCEEFCAAVAAKYTVVSVGKKPDNDAGSKYKKHSKKVFSTRFHGTIYAELDFDGSVRIYDHARARIDEEDKVVDALAALLARAKVGFNA